jgi:uncharacterized protein
MKRRYLQENIHADLQEKMVFLSGPRQVGKTTVAKTFLKTQDDLYYNWDRREDRKSILAGRWPAVSSTVVLDELHKYRRWKNWIKGEYDTHGDRVHFLVTGSARLDIYRKGGDSLQGRYHAHRLHGFSVGELLYTKRSLPAGGDLDFSRQLRPKGLIRSSELWPFPGTILEAG